MIDRVLDRLTCGIEQVLAYAFIFAVALNFANVVGRYGFGRMMLGADEIQIYIMVCMAFLGAAVISWRREHLRMDVLFKLFPRPVRTALRVIDWPCFGLVASRPSASWRSVTSPMRL